jgi:hypothetical protein
MTSTRYTKKAFYDRLFLSDKEYEELEKTLKNSCYFTLDIFTSVVRVPRVLRFTCRYYAEPSLNKLNIHVTNSMRKSLCEQITANK